jgi:hypothetical protein
MILLGGEGALAIDQGIRLQQRLPNARKEAKNVVMVSDPPQAGEMGAEIKRVSTRFDHCNTNITDHFKYGVYDRIIARTWRMPERAWRRKAKTISTEFKWSLRSRRRIHRRGGWVRRKGDIWWVWLR